METDPHNPAAEEAPLATVSQPAPLDIVRTETVLSKLPVHNLSKKGRVNIQILKTTLDGQVELKWEVSYSDRYGQARQLAYKLDTIVIDPRIEEAGRPLPNRICLGSLNQIAQELCLVADHGTTSQHLKRAFRQNALAGITAKFKYASNNGSERTLEATFTRYSVIFTGEKFSDGFKSDAVYIELNPTYQEVLNNAPVRPLDLGYKKQLAPGPQRFYEIVSYKIFAALKNNNPLARLPYSEYCTFSAQQRYLDYDHFKKQMYKIHRPHLASGYITKVQYTEAVDEQGQADWMMCYVPGPKACAEYATFTGKKLAPAPAQERQLRQRRLHLTRESQPQPAAAGIIAELAKRGIGEADARQLLASLPPGQPVLEQLRWGDYQIEQARGTITNPPGFYISLLQRNVPVRRTSDASRGRKTQQKARAGQPGALQQQTRTVQEAEEAERRKLDDQIAALPALVRQALFEQAKAELLASYPGMAVFFKANPDDAINDGAVRARMRQLMSAW
jgi:hypothetical protein